MDPSTIVGIRFKRNFLYNAFTVRPALVVSTVRKVEKCCVFLTKTYIDVDRSMSHDTEVARKNFFFKNPSTSSPVSECINKIRLLSADEYSPYVAHLGYNRRHILIEI